MRIFKDATTRDRYYIDYWFRSKRWRYVAGTSLRAATTLQTRVQSEINSGIHDPQKVKDEIAGRGVRGTTFGDLVERFLGSYRSKQGNIKYYQSISKPMVAFFGKTRPLAEITSETVEAFRNASAEAGMQPATVSQRLIALGTIFRWGVKKHLVPDNPAQALLVTRPHIPRKRVIPLTEDQQEKFLDMCDADLRRLARLILETGMRLSAPLKMKRTDLDTKSGWMNVPPHKTNPDGYRIPYTDTLKDIINNGPRVLHSEYVFCWTYGPRLGQPLHPNTVSKSIKKAMLKAGIPDASAHTLRHTFASRLAMAGVPMADIAALLGQSTVTVTEMYVHFSAEYMQRMAKGLERGKKKGPEGG